MHEIFEKVCDTVKPSIALLGAGITFALFPEQSFIIWFVATWVAVVFDLFTKWLAIFATHGGISNSIKTKAWNSDSMFHKTYIKIVAYLVIQILTGLSMRIGMPHVNNAIATVVYSFIFFREFASNIENLIEAGADYLWPLLFWVKKKQDEVIPKDCEELNKKIKDERRKPL